MLIRLCQSNGITPICTVRREEQAEMLRTKFGVKNVVNLTKKEDYPRGMGMMCMKYKPSVCLECIAGEMTGQMLDFMGFASTLILYGLLSDKPASGIDVIGFIGKGQTIESYVLNNMLSKMSMMEYGQFVLRVMPLYSSDLQTEV